jgi:hypothetical protein
MLDLKSFVLTLSMNLISSYSLDRTPIISVYFKPNINVSTPSKHFFK